MTSNLVFFSSCFFRKRWNSAWTSTLARRLSLALSGSATRMNGASAMRSLPRSGSFGFRGRRSLTWSTLEHARHDEQQGREQSPEAAAPA